MKIQKVNNQELVGCGIGLTFMCLFGLRFGFGFSFGSIIDFVLGFYKAMLP